MKINVLIAFPYFSASLREVLESVDPSRFRLMVDSGAFTAHSQGVDIELPDYHELLDGLPKAWEWKAIQLDVIGDPEGSYRNLLASVDAGYDVMPVFTRGDDIANLERLYEHGDYVLFGGNVGKPDRKTYFKYFMDHAKGRKVHWLGVVDTALVKYFKPYSVDSSYATAGQRYNNCNYYVGGGRLKQVRGRKLYERPPQEFIDAVMRLGFTMREIRSLGQAEAWRGTAAPPNEKSPYGLGSFVNFVAHVYRSWDVERNVGTKVYHAAASKHDLSNLFAAQDFLKQRGILK